MPTEQKAWFQTSYFEAQKVLQHNTLNPDSPWASTQDYLDALHAVAPDATPWDNWFDAGSQKDNVSPNELFNTAYYFAAVAAKSNADNYQGQSDWTPDKIEDLMTNTFHISAWEHYKAQGIYDGIDPSQAFDTDLYIQNRVDQLNAYNNGQGWGGNNHWTTQQYKDTLVKAGINPIEDLFLNTNYTSSEEGKQQIFPVPQDQLVDFDPNWNPWMGQSPQPPAPTEPPSPYDDVQAHVTLTTENSGPYNSEDGVNTQFDAIYPSRRADATLHPEDVIAGGENAYNTLAIELGRNWPGFDGIKQEGTTALAPNVTNVGRIELHHTLNDDEAPYSFNAKNIGGAEEYVLNDNGAGAFSLTNLAQPGITVRVNGLTGENANSNTGIAFDSASVTGSSDALTLSLNNVGSAATPQHGVWVANFTANGIEDLTVHGVAGSNNFVNLTNVKGNTGTTDLTIDGIGNTTITGVAATVNNVDASEAIGNVDVNLTNATNRLTELKGGQGNDTFRTATLDRNTAVDGGEGSNTLILNQNGVWRDMTWQNIQTVGVGETCNDTFWADNLKDLTGLRVEKSANGFVRNVTADTFTVTNTTGASSANVTNDIEVNGDVNNLVYNTNTGLTAISQQITHLQSNATNDVTVNIAPWVALQDNNGGGTGAMTSFRFNEAEGDVVLNVGSNATTGVGNVTQFAGTFNAKNATTFTANIDGILAKDSVFTVVNNADNIGADTAVTINAQTGVAGKSGADSSVGTTNDDTITLMARGANTIDINTGGDMTLKAGSDVSNAQDFQITLSNGEFTSEVDFTNASTVNIQADTEAGDNVTLTNIGNAKSQSPIDLDVLGVDTFTVGNVTAGYAQNIDINVQALGDMTIGKVTVNTDENGNRQGDVTISLADLDSKGSNIGIESVDGDELDINFSGVTGNAKATGNSNFIQLSAIQTIDYNGANGVDYVVVNKIGSGTSHINLGQGADMLDIAAQRDPGLYQITVTGGDTDSADTYGIALPTTTGVFTGVTITDFVTKAMETAHTGWVQDKLDDTTGVVGTPAGVQSLLVSSTNADQWAGMLAKCGFSVNADSLTLNTAGSAAWDGSNVYVASFNGDGWANITKATAICLQGVEIASADAFATWDPATELV